MSQIDKTVNPKAIKDLIDLNNALQETKKEMSGVLAENEKLKEQYEAQSKSIEDTSKKYKAYTDMLNKAADNNNKLVATTKELESQQKQLTAIDAKLLLVNKESNKELIKKQIELKKERAAITESITGAKASAEARKKDAEATRKAAKEEKEATKAKEKAAKEQEKLNKLNNISATSLDGMRLKLKKLTTAYDSAAVRTDSAAKEIHKLSTEIGLAEQATNRHQRGVGGYREQLDGLRTNVMNGTTSFAQMKSGIIGVGKAAMTFLLSPVGMVIALIGGLVLAGKALIQNAQGFEKAASSLSAITGQVGEDLDFMKQKAIEFSKSSLSSAEDILGAFEKVGSAMPALLQNGALLTEVTKNALVLSEATGGKLSVEDAAKAAAGAMNQFNIPLTESAKAVNILAAGSLAGSADITSLSESLKNVGAVASGADLTLEQTVGLLEVLGEKSLFGTEAGTKLRGSILKLQAAGLGYTSGVFNMKDALEEANQKINEQGTALERDAYMQKVFGAENITAGKILLSNVEKYEKLTDAVTGTNTAFDQQETQMNNLEGSYAKLGNLWKAFMLGFEDGNGLIAKVWKGLVDFTASFIDGMIQWQKAFTSLFEMFESKKTKAEKRARKEEKDRLAAIEAQKQAEQVAADLKAKEEQAELDRLSMIALKEKEKADEAEKAAEKIRLANEKAIADQNKLLEAQFKINQDRAKQEYDMQVMIINATATSKEDADNKIFEFKKEQLQKTFDLLQIELDAFEGTELEKIAIQERLNKARYDLEKSGMEERIKLNEVPLEKMKPIAKEEVGLEFEKLEEITAANEEHAEKEKEKLILSQEEKGLIIEEGINAAINIQSALFDFMASKYSGDLELLEQRNAAGELSDEEYARQKGELELKAAKTERAAALFSIAINTAISVAKVWGQTGIAGIIAQAAPIAMGAIEAAIVMAKPLPAFLDGGDVKSKMFTVAEDNKPELWLGNGKAVEFNEPGIVNDSSFIGGHIFPNKEYEQMKTQTDHSGFSSQSFSDKQILKKFDSLENTIKNKEVIIFDHNNRPIGRQVGSHREIRLNRIRHE